MNDATHDSRDPVALVARQPRAALTLEGQLDRWIELGRAARALTCDAEREPDGFAARRRAQLVAESDRLEAIVDARWPGEFDRAGSAGRLG